MISEIANFLKGKITSEFNWLDNLAGLVEPAHVQSKEGKTTGIKIYPVACVLNKNDNDTCKEDLEAFVPNSDKKAVGYFVETSPQVFMEAKNRAEVDRYSFSLKLCIWLNGKRLKSQHSCSLSSVIAPFIVKHLSGKQDLSLADNFLQENISKVEVLNCRILTKAPGNWGAFSFVSDGVPKGIWLAPYDHLVIEMSGYYQTKKCLGGLDIIISEPC